MSSSQRIESDSPFRARVAYTAGPDGELRPYVSVELTGPNARPVQLRGLIDSGADRTMLPLQLASILGFEPTSLSSAQIVSSFGVKTVYEPSTALRAQILGQPASWFDFTPLFLEDGQEVLFGRLDFMTAFAVSFAERDKEFSLFKR